MLAFIFKRVFFMHAFRRILIPCPEPYSALPDAKPMYLSAIVFFFFIGTYQVSRGRCVYVV